MTIDKFLLFKITMRKVFGIYQRDKIILSDKTNLQLEKINVLNYLFYMPEFNQAYIESYCHRLTN